MMTTVIEMQRGRHIMAGTAGWLVCRLTRPAESVVSWWGRRERQRSTMHSISDESAL